MVSHLTRAPSRSYEPLAVRLCKAVHDLAGDKPGQRISVTAAAKAIKVADQEMINGAISHAVQRGWLRTGGKPAHSLLLTPAGEAAALKKSAHPYIAARLKAARGSLK
jgi:hypothetical protein